MKGKFTRIIIHTTRVHQSKCMSYRLSADHLTKREQYKQAYIVRDLVVSALTCLSVRGQMPPFAKVAAKTAPRRQSTSIEQS